MNWTSKCAIVWLLLVALTFGSYLVVGSNDGPAISSVVVIALAAIKGALIMLFFMKVAHAPRNWKLLYGSWLAGVVLILGLGQFAAHP